jgi:hypothetical protein
VESALHNFTGGVDGADPQGGVILGADGDVYGATVYGGSGIGMAGHGVIYELTP